MARDTGRSSLRDNIASIAARLMAEDGIEDYAQAKRKAARQAGASDTRQMPTNDEIDVALAAYRALFQHDHALQLRELRELAVAVMAEMAAFNPYLTGSVLRGSAGRYADIQLQLYCENTKSVEHHLLGRGIQFRSAEARLYAGDLPVVAPVLIFNREGYDVYLTLLSPRDLRLPLKITPAGKPIERAKHDAVVRLLAEQ
ncbi:MAG: hypothetical protein JWN94_4824 [Betaproteobacteria bacterium]|nr:hypothetical protein [Betaproteobacteria bacterium]